MKRIGMLISAALAIAITLAPRHSAADPKLVDAVVAVVGGKPITLLQVRKRARLYIDEAKRGATADWQKPELVRKVLLEVLDRMIDEALVEAAAKSASISVTNKEVEAAIARALESGGTTREALAAKGWNEDLLHEEYARQLVEQRVLSWAWMKKHDGAYPTGATAAKVWEEFRASFFAERRKATCIERRVSSHSS